MNEPERSLEPLDDREPVVRSAPDDPPDEERVTRRSRPLPRSIPDVLQGLIAAADEVAGRGRAMTTTWKFQRDCDDWVAGGPFLCGYEVCLLWHVPEKATTLWLTASNTPRRGTYCVRVQWAGTARWTASAKGPPDEFISAALFRDACDCGLVTRTGISTVWVSVEYEI